MVDQRNALGLMRNGRAVRASVDFDQSADQSVVLAAVAGSVPILIDPALIRKDGGTQMRVRLDVEAVHEYHAMIKDAGGAWPFRDPVRLVFDGSDYWLVDGFHRLQAWAMHYMSPAPAVPALVEEGDLRAAVLAAAGANAEHGLRRTNADKQRAVDALLQDEEWGKWSDGEIARRCGVSRPFVSSRRAARAATRNVAAPDPETVTYRNKHGGISTMQTGGIANSNRARSAAGGLAAGKLGGNGAAVVGSSAGGSRATNTDSVARCSMCNRPLTDPAAVVNGIGPCCAAKAAKTAALEDERATLGKADSLRALREFYAAAVVVLDGADLYGDLAGGAAAADVRRVMIDVVRRVGAKLTAEGA